MPSRPSLRPPAGSSFEEYASLVRGQEEIQYQRSPEGSWGETLSDSSVAKWRGFRVHQSFLSAPGTVNLYYVVEAMPLNRALLIVGGGWGDEGPSQGLPPEDIRTRPTEPPPGKRR